MAIKHINPYGRVEYLDKLPVRDCSCDKCERARRKERGGRRVRDAVRGAAAASQLGLAITGADASLASSALSQPSDAADSMSNIVDTAQSNERDRQGRDVRGGTRDKGSRDRGSGRRR